MRLPTGWSPSSRRWPRSRTPATGLRRRRAIGTRAIGALAIGVLSVVPGACTRPSLAPAPSPEVAAALREQEGWQQRWSRRVIGVPPFLATSADPAIGDLSFALADLLMTDLSRSAQVRIVERARLGEVIRELDLARTGRVDSASAPRVGRLLQAGRLVLGSIGPLGTGGAVRLGASIETVVDGTVQQAVDAQAPLADILAAEKALAFRLLESLGVTLAPAERAAIEARPTANLQALLAYGRGVRREYQGDFLAARREYQEAARLDARFRQADTRVQEMRTLARAATLDPDLIPGLRPRGTALGAAVDQVNRPLPLTTTGTRTFTSPVDPGFPEVRGTLLITVVRP
jgi:TolB-like protein